MSTHKFNNGARNRLCAITRRADSVIDVALGALLIGALDRPGLPMERYVRHLEKMISETIAYVGESDNPPLERRIEALREVIIRRYGYSGTPKQTHIDAINLTRTIDRRCGHPFLIGLLMLETARGAGWCAEAIVLGERLLVRLVRLRRHIILDPAGTCAPLNARQLRTLFKRSSDHAPELAPGIFEALGSRAILLALLETQKNFLLKGNNLAGALGRIETALDIAPDNAALWHEAGLLHARLGNVREAVVALEEYIRRGADSQGGEGRGAYQATVLLQELRSRPGA